MIAEEPSAEVQLAQPATHYSGRILRYSAGAICAIIFFLAPCGVINHGDGIARYAQTKALLLHGSLSIPPDIAHTKRGKLIGGMRLAPNGKVYCKYGIGTSLVWLVPTMFAWVVSRFTGADLDTLAGFGISFVNPVFVVATARSIWWVLRELGATPRACGLTILLYLFGTSTLAYANTAFSEPTVGFLLLWAIVLPALRTRLSAAATSGVLLTCCTLVKPELVLLPTCLIPLFIGKDRVRSLVVFCATAALGGMFLAVNNFVCRGSFTSFSYGSEASQFQAPWTALVKYFFGIDRNILLFNPALLLAAAGALALRQSSQWRRLLLACSLVWIVYLPFYASWWAWQGGMCFGPRFFQSFMPVTLLPSGIGLIHLVERARSSVPVAMCAIIAVAFVVLIIPLQIAGASIKNEQAVSISTITGRTEAVTHVQLMALKLHRGLTHPEVYRKSDFAKLRPRDYDTAMDFRTKPTFQFLNHWWLLYIVNKKRHITAEDAPILFRRVQ